MIQFGVCLETVYTNLPVEARIQKIVEAGYSTVEFWHPEGTFDGKAVRTDLAKDPVALRRACEKSSAVLNDFAFHAWDGSIGGSPVRPADREKFLEQVRKMLAFAREAGSKNGIVLSGVVDPGLSSREMRGALELALAEAVVMARCEGVSLLLEPLNTLVDHPGYYLERSAGAFEIVKSINDSHLKVLYDVYHMQIMEGNLLATIEKNLEWIGHFHSAGVPGRGELFGTEVNYPELIRRLDALGYDGAFGLEYFPRMADHSESLRRTLEYLRAA